MFGLLLWNSRDCEINKNLKIIKEFSGLTKRIRREKTLLSPKKVVAARRSYCRTYWPELMARAALGMTGAALPEPEWLPATLEWLLAAWASHVRPGSSRMWSAEVVGGQQG
ncbi:hypothetical protein CJ030_MR2G019444 [Morella rubra]|uniref:Uncharacterized protein n=1 Tax=Morella rubra TaxID=262757 RepID=A0A6A1WCF8_9ROSI|nr:hypothetical protein CJ030_MR2G019444 [Morella rubra]